MTKLAESKSAVGAKLGEQAARQTADTPATKVAAATSGPVVRRPAAEEAAIDEPARMVRRMRPTEPEITPVPVVGPRNQLDHGLGKAAPAQTSQVQASQAPTPKPAPAPAVRKPVPPAPANEVAPPWEDETPAPPRAAREELSGTPEEIADELEQGRPTIRRHVDDPSPASPIAQRTPPQNRLTVNVQEGETEDDIETDDEGELIEELYDEEINYIPPSIELLVPQSEQADVNDDELAENARILQQKLGTFNIQIENLTVTPGPVVTLYEFVPAAGIKLSQIESLADDIALAMKARGIRIIAPIPGKGTVGVEIPNHKPAMVRIRSVLNTAKFREATSRLPLALGKTTVGEVFCDDLAKMPHLLIAGATGSGKSVGINSILGSLIYRMHPRDLKFVIIDPKKIELTLYRSLKDHFIARCPDIDEDIITTPQNAVLALKSLELEMDRRYDILAKVGQRNIFDYNQKIEEGKYRDVKEYHHVKLPYIVLILDELADLMMTAAKEVEEPIARLAQLARAIGIHMVVATQRPSVDVITGIIKANFPARIAYQVASKIDSRTILDMNGAEQLLGNGDMLYLPPGTPKPLRLQNAFISTEEVEALCDHIGHQKGYTRPYNLPSVVEKTKKGAGSYSDQRDELFEEAARLIVRHQQGSVSLIQRRLKVGYSRAARIVDELEMAGIVGSFDGSKARQVLIESEAELEAFL
jgi:S-DNA-T family DNA segregation ATPase FtsK/SpoIIIE